MSFDQGAIVNFLCYAIEVHACEPLILGSVVRFSTEYSTSDPGKKKNVEASGIKCNLTKAFLSTIYSVKVLPRCEPMITGSVVGCSSNNSTSDPGEKKSVEKT